VKYADGPTVEVETLVDAPLAVVWALVSDITTPVRFSEELQEARWIDEQRFVGRSRHPAIGEWETTCSVTTCVAEREFGWVVGDPAHPSAAWRFTLEAAEGRTRLRQWMRMGPAPSGLNVAIDARPDKEERIVARRLEEHRANMQTTVDGIKCLAEAATD
jgi:hypothetical protein